jgi:xanthine dehydrogenase C subunit
MAIEPNDLFTGKKRTILLCPSTVEEAWSYKRRFGDAALYVAGGTWLRTRWEADLAPSEPEYMISLENIATLRSLHLQQDGSLTIGAAVRVAQLIKHDAVKTYYPLMSMAAAQIAAPSIRNQATVGGNIMTGTGDLLPALLASEALLIVYDGRRTDRIPVADWVEMTAKPAELMLAGVKIYPMKESHHPFYHKIGRREQFTPAIVSAAGWFYTEGDGRISRIRLAAGGFAFRPLRLRKAELAALWGQPGEVASAVHKAVEGEMPEVTDDYAPAAFRRLAAANLIAAELVRAGR